MKDFIFGCACLIAIVYFGVAGIGNNSIKSSEKELLILNIEKTTLEIQKLKYELQIYKENAESLK